MHLWLVRLEDGQFFGRCDEPDEDGNVAQIAEGNTEWEAVDIGDAMPDPARQKWSGAEVVDKTAGEIEAEATARAEATVLDVGKLPATDLTRLTHEALWKVEKATGEIPESTTFEEYLQGLVDSGA